MSVIFVDVVVVTVVLEIFHMKYFLPFMKVHRPGVEKGLFYAQANTSLYKVYGLPLSLITQWFQCGSVL